MSRVSPSKVILAVVGFAAQAGVSPVELLRATGLHPATCADPDAFVPSRQERRLWEAAVCLTGDQNFGLHLAEWVCRSPEDHFDVLAYATRSCATLGEHYARMGLYIRLLHADAYHSLEVEGDVARLAQGFTHEVTGQRQPMECAVALSFLQGRRSIGEEFAVREVCFAHPAPARVSEQERLFQAPVRYAAPRNELVFDSALLERPQRHAEPRLLGVLSRQLEELMSRLPETRSCSALVQRLMLDELPDREPTVRSVARLLRVSPRSLQRRLSEEGTSFNGLLDELRRDLALRYLEDRRLSIGEVGFLLGFSEVSAFHRAFKRWTGTTPTEQRRGAPRQVESV